MNGFFLEWQIVTCGVTQGLGAPAVHRTDPPQVEAEISFSELSITQTLAGWKRSCKLSLHIAKDAFSHPLPSRWQIHPVVLLKA